MVGTDRGVGAGGSSKSSRLRMLFCLLGVEGLGLDGDLLGERWLLIYCRRLDSVADLLGELGL